MKTRLFVLVLLVLAANIFAVAPVCGDGVCDLYEYDIICPEDCTLNPDLVYPDPIEQRLGGVEPIEMGYTAGTYASYLDGSVTFTLLSSAAGEMYLEGSVDQNGMPYSVDAYLTAHSTPSSANVTLGGLMPESQYYFVVDGNEYVQVVTNDIGKYTLTLYTDVDHSVTLSKEMGTLQIRDDATGGECTQKGTWDASTKTCTLTADVNEGVRLFNSDLTLDCAGHTITTSGGTWGVFLQAVGDDINNVVVKNCNIQSDGSTNIGIRSVRAKNSQILNNHVTNFALRGVEFRTSSNGNTVSGNTISEIGSDGVHITQGSSANTIHNNTISSVHQHGVHVLQNSADNVISDNMISDADSRGIYVNPTVPISVTITGNAISDTGDTGIEFEKTVVDSLVQSNTITNAGNNGINIEDSSNGNTVQFNVITGSANHGITAFGNSLNNDFFGNQVRYSGQYGIFMQGSPGNTNKVGAGLGTGNTACYNSNYDIREITNSATWSDNTCDTHSGGDAFCAYSCPPPPPCLTITSDTVLTQDYTNCPTGAAVIKTDGVTLDCAGHAFFGPGSGSSYGIEIEADNITVKDCTVRGYFTGIYVHGSQGVVLQDNNALLNYIGLDVFASSDGSVTGNSFTNNDGNNAQFTGFGNSGNTISGNTFSGSIYANGLLDSSGIGNTISDNTATHNFNAGIIPAFSTNDLILNNTASDNQYGIYLYGSLSGGEYQGRNVTVQDNYVTLNGRNGIQVQNHEGTTLSGNIAENNAQEPGASYNIFLSFSPDTTMTGNRLLSGPYREGDSDFGLRVEGFEETQTIDDTNTIRGVDGVERKILYLVGSTSGTYGDSDTGAMWCIDCSNVVLRDAQTSHNRQGVRLLRSNNVRVENVSMDRNLVGMGVMYTTGLIADTNVYRDNIQFGVIDQWGNGTAHNVYSNSEFERAGIIAELYVTQSSQDVIENNTFIGYGTGMSSSGVSLTSGSDNTQIRSNSFTDFYGYGPIYMSSASNVVENNTLSFGRKGIEIGNVNNQIRGNLIDHMQQAIRAQTTQSIAGNVFEENTITDSSGQAFYFVLSSNANNVAIRRNVLLDNALAFQIFDVSGMEIVDNIVRGTEYLETDNIGQTWNTPQTAGTNIVGGPYLGGNYWTNLAGTGFSDTCTNADGDGLCDDAFLIAANNTDNLPLTAYDVTCSVRGKVAGQPGMQPLEGAKCLVYDRNDPDVQAYHPDGTAIREHAGLLNPLAECTTGANGQCSVPIGPDAQIYCLAEYDGYPDVYPSHDLGSVSGDNKDCSLVFHTSSDGNTKPMKTSKQTGSLLWVFEPEYVLWESTSEEYPFLFESDSPWDVEVCLNTPEGYETDGTNCQNGTVANNNEMLFDVVEVGSVPGKTKTKMKFKSPSGKTTTKNGEVGIRMSKGLAKQKGAQIDSHGRVTGLPPQAKGQAKAEEPAQDSVFSPLLLAGLIGVGVLAFAVDAILRKKSR